MSKGVAGVSGAQKAIVSSPGSVAPGRVTPITVSGAPASTISLPTIDGSALKYRRQPTSDKTPTGADAEEVKSADVSERPSAVGAPRTAKYSPLTRCPGT